MKLDLQRSAVISTCRRYRFELTRAHLGVDPISPTVAFVLCNPSTADDEIDDATCRRGWGFAQSLGFSRMLFVNTNPFRATNPDEQQYPEPWALEENDAYICMAGACDLVICAWGTKAHPTLVDRAVKILKHVTQLHYLALCVDKKTPKHPLYLASVLRPTPWDI